MNTIKALFMLLVSLLAWVLLPDSFDAPAAVPGQDHNRTATIAGPLPAPAGMSIEAPVMTAAAAAALALAATKGKNTNSMPAWSATKAGNPGASSPLLAIAPDRSPAGMVKPGDGPAR